MSKPRGCLRIVDVERTPAVRRLTCARYSACLDVAVAREWESFTCEGCDGFVATSPEQLEQDREGLIECAAEAFRQGRLGLRC